MANASRQHFRQVSQQEMLPATQYPLHYKWQDKNMKSSDSVQWVPERYQNLSWSLGLISKHHTLSKNFIKEILWHLFFLKRVKTLNWKERETNTKGFSHTSDEYGHGPTHGETILSDSFKEEIAASEGLPGAQKGQEERKNWSENKSLHAWIKKNIYPLILCLLQTEMWLYCKSESNLMRWGWDEVGWGV